jgi:hypothetical protein
VPTDKYLLAAFITALIGFITAAMSIVRLVNDKESKTTDYRQAWTDSLRTSFATLISKIELVAVTQGHYLNQANFLNTFTPSGTAKDKDAVDYNLKVHEELTSTRARLSEELLTAYALTRLHFKPNDLSFSRVEHKFEHIVDLLQRLGEMNSADAVGRQNLVGQVRLAASELTGFARDILKTEWEAVKRGEQAYQTTKRWSIFAGGFTLVVLLIFGGVALWSAGTSKSDSTPPSYAITAPASEPVRPENGTKNGTGTPN